MSDRRVFEITAERDGAWWFLQVPELGRSTQVKRLDRSEAMARDLIATWLEIDPDSFDLRLVGVDMGPEMNDAWRSALSDRIEAERATNRAAFSTRQAIEILTAKGLSIRDVGMLLGVSFQRVQQLAAAPETNLSLLERDEAHQRFLKRLDAFVAEAIARRERDDPPSDRPRPRRSGRSEAKTAGVA